MTPYASSCHKVLAASLSCLFLSTPTSLVRLSIGMVGTPSKVRRSVRIMFCRCCSTPVTRCGCPSRCSCCYFSFPTWCWFFTCGCSPFIYRCIRVSVCGSVPSDIIRSPSLVFARVLVLPQPPEIFKIVQTFYAQGLKVKRSSQRPPPTPPEIRRDSPHVTVATAVPRDLPLVSSLTTGVFNNLISQEALLLPLQLFFTFDLGLVAFGTASPVVDRRLSSHLSGLHR
eukprot:GHVT01058566.1.p1 GENE.GHVT01058566.1~~GHVT01058566.1.p1  ORF type:complete len:227 (+),score=4.31 GHVT01058566.1:814-1494(+)